MRAVLRSVIVAGLALAAALHLAPAKAAAPTLDDPLGAAQLLTLANVDRAAAGLPLLVPRDDLTTIALEHSRRMALADDIWHNDAYFSSSVKAQVGAKSLGENVAMNRSMDDAHRRLLASPGPRDNLLNPKFTVVGFAVVRAADGIGYVTQAFIEPLAGTAPPPVASPAAAPAPVAEVITPPAPAPAPPTPPLPPAPTTTAPPAPTATTAPVPAAPEPAPDPSSVKLSGHDIALPEANGSPERFTEPGPTSAASASEELAAGTLASVPTDHRNVPLALAVLAGAALLGDLALLARRRPVGGHRLGG